MRFARERRKPAWTYTTRGVLWGLQTGSPDFLVGEDRILDAKTVSFFCLDRRTGVPRWEGFVPGEGWWSGIEAVAGGVVLFHGFARPDMPLHRGVTAVDLASGSVVWTRPAVRFLGLEADAVLVAPQGGEGGEVERLGLETGTALEGRESARPSPGISRNHDLMIGLPRPLAETEIEDSGLLAAVGRAIPQKAIRESILLVRGEEYCALAYCEPRLRGRAGEPGFRSSLVVLGGPRWGEIYSAAMHTEAGAITPEPFFCQEGILYFVQNRSTLVAVPLRVS